MVSFDPPGPERDNMSHKVAAASGASISALQRRTVVPSITMAFSTRNNSTSGSMARATAGTSWSTRLHSGSPASAGACDRHRRCRTSGPSRPWCMRCTADHGGHDRITASWTSGGAFSLRPAAAAGHRPQGPFSPGRASPPAFYLFCFISVRGGPEAGSLSCRGAPNTPLRAPAGHEHHPECSHHAHGHGPATYGQHPPHHLGGRWVIKQQHLRIHGQCPAMAMLLLAAGDLPGPGVDIGGHTHLLQILHGLLPACSLGRSTFTCPTTPYC